MENVNLIATLALGVWLYDETLVVRIVFLVIAMIVSRKIFLYLKSVCEPMNYELDMTTKEYCKMLAEVNNDLKFQTKHSTKRVTQNNKEQTQESLDCATGLLDNASAGTQSCEPPFRMGFKSQPQFDPASRRVVESQGPTNSGNDSIGDTQIGSSDHVYPNGWLPVMESAKVKAGEIKRAIMLGRDIIVTRSSEGQVNVLDAYCPHMGVHIGVGGRVLRIDNESCVQCPFHGWTFRASDGQCVSVPYVTKRNCSNSKYGGTSIPKQAKLNNWLCNEVDDFIYVWHHIDGQPPNWQLEPTPELASGQFILAGRSLHKTNLEMRDMHENGADMNHFEGIHNDLFVFGGKFLQVQAWNYIQRYSRHHWSPDWRPILNDEGKSTHMAQMSLESWISLYKMRIFDIDVRATQIGPACVSLRYTSKWYGSGVLKMNAIPLGGRRTLYVQHIYTEKSIFNWLMAKWVLFGEIMQLERDLFIWNHKKNIVSPVFVPEDKIIKRFRLWYSQFYKRKCKITIKDTDNNDNSKTSCLVVDEQNNFIDF